MSRPKGSKNKSKGSATNGTLVVKNKKIAKALANHPRNANHGEVGKPLFGNIEFPVFDKNVVCDLTEERIWITNMKAFCEKKGFPPVELIEKFEELERDLKESQKQYTDFLESEGLIPASTKHTTQSKPKELSSFMKSRQNSKNGMKDV